MSMKRLPGKVLGLIHRVLLRIGWYRRLVFFLGLDSYRYKKYYQRLDFETTEGVLLSDVDHYKDEGEERRVEQLVENLARQITQPRDVLDIGCGTGRYLKQMQQVWPGAILQGIDISTGIVEKFTRHHVPGISIHILDIETDEQFYLENANRFDLVCMIAIIQVLSLKRIAAIVRKVNTLCQVGGYFYLQFNVETEEKKSTVGYKRYAIKELVLILQDNGFRVVVGERTDILKDYAYIIARKV